MSDLVFPAPPLAAVAVRGGGRYAVRRIFCVGRNYAAHAREMGSNPDREPPFFFAKSPMHLAPGGSTMAYPPGTHDLHHEMELVVAIGKAGSGVPASSGWDHVWGYACGLDLTRRDLQAIAKKAGRPWTFGKDFEGSAVVGELVPASAAGHIERGAITLSVNGELRQQGDLSELIWSIPEVVSNLSDYYHLQPGDLIYTGTPAGVGAVRPGDRLHGSVEGVGEIELAIAPAA